MSIEVQETVEELDEQLDVVLKKIEDIAAITVEGGMDAYEGFMKTEEHKDKIVEIGNKLKAKGVDISTRV